MLKYSIFLTLFGVRMSSKTLFEVAKNDVNRVRKEIAVEFFNLISSGRPQDGLRFFAPHCKTHNPYTVGGIKELIDAMIAVQKQGSQGIIQGSTADFKLIIRQVLAEGNLVAVHTQISGSNPSSGGLRQVHIFRFNADKIEEYWDITQMIPENAPNAFGAFS